MVMGQADNPWTVLGLERTGDMQAGVAVSSSRPTADYVSTVVEQTDAQACDAGGEAPVAQPGQGVPP